MISIFFYLSISTLSSNCGTGELVISSSTKTIGESEYEGCSGYTGTLKIPSTVEKIYNRAFYGCSGFENELIIPGSVTSIGEYAFACCDHITKLQLPELTSISEGTFYKCTALSGNLILKAGLQRIYNFAFYNCYGFDGSLSLPNSLKYINEFAFCGCSGFKGDLNIPSSVVRIEAFAFCNCSGFDGTIKLPYSITRIYNHTFYNCHKLKGEISLYSVTQVDSYAFAYCYEMQISALLNANYIGSYAFCNCSGINETLSLSDEISQINEYTFYGCTGVPKIYLPSKIKRIEKYAFCECTNLQYLYLYSSIDFIGEKAYYNCFRLNGTLDISKVKTIEELAFGYTNFSIIKFSGNEINCSDNVFTNNPNITAKNYNQSNFCGIDLIPSVMTPSKSPYQTAIPTWTKDNKKSKKQLKIIFAVVGSLLGLIIIGCIIWWLIKKYCSDCCDRESSSDEFQRRDAYETKRYYSDHFDKVEDWNDPFDIIET